MKIGKHLAGCMTYLRGINGNGTCFQRAIALALDHQFGKLTIGVVGTGDANGQPFLHAWVEQDEKLFVPTLIERQGGLIPVKKVEYYAANGIRDARKIDRRELLAFAKEAGLRKHFLEGDYHLLSEPLVPALLKRLRYPYRISPEGGMLPVG